MEDTFKKIVEDLAKWSRKYPRERVYGFSKKNDMDAELIKIEERAKNLIDP